MDKTIVVIFRSVPDVTDEEYERTSEHLKALAFEEFGCLDYASYSEGEEKVTLSYWPSEEHVRLWKKQSDHITAQRLGRVKWYKHFSIQVAEIVREYAFNKVS